MGARAVSLTLLSAGWRHWLLQQVERGADPAALLRHLSAGGQLRAHAALRAIDEALTQRNRTGPQDKPGACGPRPRLETGRRLLVAQGQQVSVRMALDCPGVAVVDNLLDGVDCALLRTLVEREASRWSHAAASGLRAAFSHPIIDRLAARLSALVNWPLAGFQPLQVRRLQPGDACRLCADGPHGGTNDTGRGGLIVGSFVVFLDTPADGGAIGLPGAMGFRALPQAGTAIWFDHQWPGGADAAALQAAATPTGADPPWVVTASLHTQDWPPADTA